MSIIRCTSCMRFIDTDFETEFYYKDSPYPVCHTCLIEKEKGDGVDKKMPNILDKWNEKMGRNIMTQILAAKNNAVNGTSKSTVIFCNEEYSIIVKKQAKEYRL